MRNNILLSLVVGLIIFLVVFLGMIVNNEYATNNQPVQQETELNVEVSDAVRINGFLHAYVKKIHGCEYIIISGPKKSGIVHHAACNNINHTQ